MTREYLLPPYTVEEKLRELCMRNRALCGRIRHKRQKSRKGVPHKARLRDKR